MAGKAYLLGILSFVFVLVGVAAGQDTIPTDTKPTRDARISLGPLDEIAVNLPNPVYPRSRKQPKYPGIIFVKVELDLREGKIVNAKAITGFPGFRKYAEDAAFRAKFQPTELDGPPLIGEGILTYRYPTKGKRTKGSAPPKALPVIVGDR